MENNKKYGGTAHKRSYAKYNPNIIGRIIKMDI